MKSPAPDSREIVITRVFDAPRELVWQAWTDARHLARWWGPHQFTNPVCEVDLRPGGAIRIVMRGPEGVDYPMGGNFREIVTPERLVMVTAALNDKGRPMFEFLHRISFEEQGARTKLTIRSQVISQTGEADHYIGGYEAGMTQSLERLASLLAKA